MDISTQWQVLGPFQIGTREATWGADPLDCLGGFPDLAYNVTSRYDSSLSAGGTVGWSLLETEVPKKDKDSVEASLVFSFTDIDWAFLQSIYGWAAFQFQAWGRGEIVINAGEPQTIILYTDNVLEFYIDRQSYFGGDFYAYRRAPLVLKLSPGPHTIDIRLVRDVRAMGGVGSPALHIKIRAERSTSVAGLAVIKDKILLPDMAGDRLASRLGSIPVRNDSEDWIEILELESTGQDASRVSLIGSPFLVLAPGQSRSIAFRIDDVDPRKLHIHLLIKYRTKGSSGIHVITISPTIASRGSYEPFKMTFLHPSGLVSYAILIPPKSKNVTLSHDEALPVLLNLHGAGLEADSEQVRHMLDAVDVIKAWTVFPTGVTTWSGDDWHTWGSADVFAAVAAISVWIEAAGWDGPGVALDQLYVCGHSNGGQGTWFLLSHQPDKVMAAAPVSGYSSIQAYVPYQFWTEADPRLAGVLQGSLVSYRHELFTDNFAGIPILAQHGSNDENVPVYHSRRLKQLMGGSGWSSNYAELADKGHWFDGIMTTEPMRTFYENISDVGAKQALPNIFSFVVPSSGDMGTRGGIAVDQLESPDQLGKITVVRSHESSKWTLTTSNIHRFHFSWPQFEFQIPSMIEIDGFLLPLPSEVPAAANSGLLRTSDGTWVRTPTEDWKCISQRFGAQLGAMDAILRTKGALIIHNKDNNTLEVAKQVARNLYQYYAADCPIVESIDMEDSSVGNSIGIFHGLSGVPRTLPSFPLMIDSDGGIHIRDATGRQHNYPLLKGLGVIYLQPLPQERLQLVIWGVDDRGLRHAARLVPMLTGVGQADFVVVNTESLWQGAAGVLAMGFFDHSWNVTGGSYLR